MKIINSVLLSVALLIVFSCNNERKNDFKFRFRVAETHTEYNIYFHTRVSTDFKGGSLPIVMTVLSPDNKRYTDTLSFPLTSRYKYGAIQIVRSGVWTDVKWLYRKGVTFPKKGLWLFSINQLSSMDNLKNTGDLGITITRK